MVYAVLGVAGLIIGSFLGSLTWRLPHRMSIVGPWSVCPFCKKNLRWYHNIPLVSYLILGGRCAYCHKTISVRYPLVEGGTAALFMLAGWSFLGTDNVRIVGVMRDYQGWMGLWALPYFLLIAAVLIAIAVIDLEHQIIPDVLIVPSLIFNFALLIFFSPSPTVFVHFAWGGFAASFFFVIYLLTRGRGMGLGDVSMSFLLGVLLGYPGTIVALFTAFLTGAAVGTILVLAGRARFGRPIPFGPFLIFGTFVALFISNTIVQWYLP